jgi:hypothetical protein
MEDHEIEAVLSKIDELVSWASDIKDYALQTAIGGKVWQGWKVVEGRSRRKYADEKAVAEAVKNIGLDPFEHKVMGITAMSTLLGKKRFEDVLGGFLIKPQGKPTLVPESDNRPAMNAAKNDFMEDKDNG